MREMGMDMRERLARAIHAAECGCDAKAIHFDDGLYVRMADAVLAAMMEPTEEMLDAAHEPARQAVSAFGKTGAFVSSAFSGPIWQAMLNAAAKGNYILDVPIAI